MTLKRKQDKQDDRHVEIISRVTAVEQSMNKPITGLTGWKGNVQ